ncbi:hypothetical protein POX_d05398 [Penicillium oxalicum]|uniref:hypothetical protein n=1 Tax=Penicillium oxalicum TaxID=69781 RepID=UPI0020B83B0D|nr:hypothetical protein POX_d05398 [Penicillium oxalicum]KAI2789899.1 hypothetical protein POX_d05398 [Penicillium oxalicum]
MYRRDLCTYCSAAGAVQQSRVQIVPSISPRAEVPSPASGIPSWTTLGNNHTEGT